MDYPHGPVSRHHHRRDDDYSNHSIYPPPPLHVEYQTFPPPPPHQIYPPPPPHQTYPPPPPHQTYPPPPPPHVESPNYPYPPRLQTSQVHHTSHENYDGGSHSHSHSDRHGFHPHVPSFIGSHFHHGGSDHDNGSSTHSYDNGPGMGLGQLVNKPSHKIHCKAGGERLAIGIREGKLVLTTPLDTDLTQHWYKDERYSTKVKDKDSHPSFLLVNKGTGQAVKHSLSCHPVQLAPYRPDVLDESLLWTESRDMGSAYRTIRTVNNVRLVMDAWNADKDHGGIHDGTVVALYETWKGDNTNQQWKFVRHCK